MKPKLTTRNNPLKRFLEDAGMTREQFARELGMSTVFVIGLVNGHNTDIRVSTLDAIHEVTKIPYQTLIVWFKSCTDKHREAS